MFYHADGGGSARECGGKMSKEIEKKSLRAPEDKL